MTEKTIAGWDIGGAHLKAALARNGRILEVRQIACPLWLGEEHLVRAFAQAGPAFTSAPIHAITMTGELAEVFPTRAEGVTRIASSCEKILKGQLLFYEGAKGFAGPEQAGALWEDIASANWRASAELAAAHHSEALFIDTGSTTTDIVPIRASAIAARGRSDAERLVAGELVYLGAIRTSLMAIARRVPFNGRWHPVVAENFSTAADIYRLTGELDPQDDLYPASDGRGKGAEDCMARLARMIGRDSSEADAREWLKLANYFREAELRLLHDAIAQVVSIGDFKPDMPVVGAGAGHFLVKALAERCRQPYVDFGDFIDVAGPARRMARVCAPAVAVALLASRTVSV